MAEAATGFRSTSIWYWRLVGSDDPAAVEAITECLAHVDDLGLRARLLANLGLEHYVAWRRDETDPPLWESLEVARRSGDAEVLRDCLAAREMTLWGPGMYVERAECAREHLTLGLSPELEITARFQLAQRRSTRAETLLPPTRRWPPPSPWRRSSGRTGLDVPLAFWRWLRADETLSPDAEHLAEVAVELHRRSSIVSHGRDPWPAPGSPCSTVGRCPTTWSQLGTGHPYLGFRAAVAHALAKSGDHERALEVLGPLEPLGTDYTALFGACLTVETLVLCGAPDEVLERAVERDPPVRRPGRHLRHGLVDGLDGVLRGQRAARPRPHG